MSHNISDRKRDRLAHEGLFRKAAPIIDHPPEPPRRMPAPWRIVEHNNSFQITDATGQALCYVYFEEEYGRRTVMKALTREEARRVAVNICKLPDLLVAK